MNWYSHTLDPIRLPEYIHEAGFRVPTAPLVARQDWARLAAAGYYRERREPLPAGVDSWGSPYIDADTHEAVYPASAIV